MLTPATLAIGDPSRPMKIRKFIYDASSAHCSAGRLLIELDGAPIGRMRFVGPLYRELVKTPDGRAFAERVYAKARPTYHPIGQASVERILKDARS